jgi:hypothetical protein
VLIEQAFILLPEILHGSGYQQQNYEAGLVGAFSLALLQALNGHNTPNPIGCLQHEKLYRPNGTYQGAPNPRYLRADLFLEIERLYVVNRRLSQYGWRHHAWLEAKFLRNQAGPDGNTHSTNKTAHAAAFLADLVRLAALVPETAQLSHAARYFLHVYDADARFYLPSRGKPWFKSLTTAGRQSLEIVHLQNESQTLRSLLGELGDFALRAQVTNLVLEPIDTEHRPVYHCILTRIDSFTCTVGDDQISLSSQRNFQSAPVGAVNRIAAFVASRLHLRAGSSEEVEPVEPDAPDDAVDEAAAPQGVPN